MSDERNPTTGDERLRAAIRAAKAEWERQAALSDEEASEAIANKFGGREESFETYQGQRLIGLLFSILQAIDEASFMRVANHG